MVSKKATEYLTGEASWAKVLGEPRPNYENTGREWSIELELDDDSIVKLVKNGLEDRIKGKGYNVGRKGQFIDRKPFIQMRQPELNKAGEPNAPIRVYDENDERWNDNILIGNKSRVVIKADIRDYGPTKKKGLYPVAIKVEKLEPYVADEFAGYSPNKPASEPSVKRSTAKKPSTFEQDFGLEADPLDDPID